MKGNIMSATQNQEDQQIDAILNKVTKLQASVEELRSKINPKWKTSGYLDSSEVLIPSSCKKIHVASKKEAIIILNSLIALKATHAQTLHFLEVSAEYEVLKIGEYPLEDYLDDLKKRYQMLILKEKENSLEYMKKVAESFESDARKKSKALSKIWEDLENFKV